jgi:biotin carboxyl carrier protein
MRRLLLRSGNSGEPLEIELDRLDESHHESYAVSIGERHMEVEIERIDDRLGWLRIHGRIVPYRVARSENSIQVWVGGRMHFVEVIERTAQRSADSAVGAAGDITAPMPGTILKIDAKQGEIVQAHETLIVMESMKMEMSLSTPARCRVGKILCEPGELVEMGELLVRLKPAE